MPNKPGLSPKCIIVCFGPHQNMNLDPKYHNLFTVSLRTDGNNHFQKECEILWHFKVI